jgi:hypothetical protein
MDGRRSVWLALCLAAGAVGCSHNHTDPAVPLLPAVTQSVAPPSPVVVPPGAVVKKECDLPKRTPKPATLVAAGDFFTGEAEREAAVDPASAKIEAARDQARRMYQQALSLDHRYLPAYRGMAQLYLSMDDAAHAVESLRKALEFYPKDAGVWFDLGMVHARRKDWPAALEALNKAVEFDPENRQFINTLGYTLARAGRYQEALDCFVRVQGQAKAHYSLARMLVHMGQSEPARDQLRQALQADPTLASAQEMLTRLEGPPQGPAPQPQQPAAEKPAVQPVVFTDAQPIPQEK